MIRFSCPGCAATFSVAEEKGGKAGKCPKCGAQFLIPEAGAVALSPAPPPPPPAPAADAGVVEIAPCPGCGMRLSVAATDLGADVQCPGCTQVFTARRPGTHPAANGSKRGLDDVLGGASRRRTEDDEDDRPSRRSRARADDEEDEDDRPSRRRRRDEDDFDDEEDRPRRKKKRRRRTEESKRITAGILAILVGGWGVHKFYLGYTTAGVIQLCLTLFTCTGGIIALVEGIIYLTKTDDEFVETYQVGQKEWF